MFVPFVPYLIVELKNKEKEKYIFLAMIIIAVLITGGLGIFEMLRMSLPRLDDEFIETYRPVCNGVGVWQASEYNSSEPGPHPTILISSDGTRHELTDQVPLDWWPENISEVELVIVCDKEQRNKIQTCHYIGGSDIKRYQYSMFISLRVAKTGSLLLQDTLEGVPPRACRGVEDASLTSIHGKHVSMGQIVNWSSLYIV